MSREERIEDTPYVKSKEEELVNDGVKDCLRGNQKGEPHTSKAKKKSV